MPDGDGIKSHHGPAPPPLDRHKRVDHLPNTRTYSLLFVHAQIEDSLTCMVVPPHRTSIPSAHNVFVLQARGSVWFVRKYRHLRVYFNSVCSGNTRPPNGITIVLVCLCIVKCLVCLSCQCGSHGDDSSRWTSHIYFSRLTNWQTCETHGVFTIALVTTLI